MANAGTMWVTIEGITSSRKVYRKQDNTLWCWWCGEFVQVYR